MDRLRHADAVTVPALVSSPAWVPLLEHLNLVLTALSLGIGLVIGLLRVYALIRALRGRHTSGNGEP